MNEKTPEWMQREERGSNFWIRFMCRFGLLLGRRASRLLIHPISLFFFCRAHVARAASAQFLTRALGRPPSWFERYKHIYYFASALLDRVFFLNGHFHDFEISLHGIDILKPLLKTGQGAFLIGAHMGSFDVMRATGRHKPGLDEPFNINVVLAMYEANANKLMAVLNAINPDAKQDIVGLGQLDSMLLLREKILAGCFVGMLADRSLGPGSMQPQPFLGEPALFATGPFTLAALLKQPTIFMLARYEGGNRYSVHLIPLVDFRGVERADRAAQLQAAMRAYVACLEAQIKLNPYNWFNFYDFWQTVPEPT
jgi:predicted LPLAT superfamily acyltransferase